VFLVSVDQLMAAPIMIKDDCQLGQWLINAGSQIEATGGSRQMATGGSRPTANDTTGGSSLKRPKMDQKLA
jgi:hypothetical protein